MKISTLSVCSVFVILSSLAHAIEPTWTTPNDLSITVPVNGTTPLSAQGVISGGAFDALLVLDTSGSMSCQAIIDPARRDCRTGGNEPVGETAENGGTQRGDWVIAGAKALVNNLDDQIRLGLVEFDTNANGPNPGILALGSSTDSESHRDSMLNAIDFVMRNSQRDGGTDLVKAIEFAANSLLASKIDDNSQHIVLVTDGSPSTDAGQTAAQVNEAAQRAIDAGIDTINTVAIPGADLDAVQDIARIGQGSFVDGSNLNELTESFALILENAEGLESLSVTLLHEGADMEIELSPELDLNGNFIVNAPIAAGLNTITATTNSKRGIQAAAELRVFGVMVPEPTSRATLIPLFLLAIWIRRGNRYSAIANRSL